MGIDLSWIDEHGGLLGGVDDPHNLTSQLLAHTDEEASRCLAFIDPYGDTVFNQGQIRILEAELRSLSNCRLSPQAEIHRREILEVIESARGKVHTYLKFVGD